MTTKRVFATALTLVLATQGVNALSFPDQESYREFMGNRPDLPLTGDRGPFRPRGNFVDPACPHSIATGRCKGGDLPVSGGGSRVPARPSVTPGTLIDSPEEAEEREGDGRRPDLLRKAQEYVAKKGLKTVLRFSKRIPKSVPDALVRTLWPERLADNDVTYPKRQSAPVFTPEGELIGRTRVPDDWEPPVEEDRAPQEDPETGPETADGDSDRQDAPPAKPGDGPPLLLD